MKSNQLHPRTLDALAPGKRHHDGRGLYLDKITAQPRWVQRLTSGGKSTMRAIGPYPAIGLSQAREISNALRNGVRFSGPEPSAPSPTFKAVLQEVIDRDAKDWRPATLEQWCIEMAKHAKPLMAMPVAAITTADIVRVLEAETMPRTTGDRMRRRITAVMRRARGQGYRADNPADDRLDDALPKRVYRGGHHAALHFSEVPRAMSAVRASDLHQSIKLAIQFAILTAARGGEVRGLVWSEIDLECETWTLPAERSKTGKQHVVPLSSAALDVLRQAAERWGQGGGYVFKSRWGGRRVSNLSRSIQDCGVTGTMHGFRAAFRTWAVEVAGARESVAEAALAHAKSSSIIASYERTTFLDARRGLMQQWADFVIRVS